MVHLPKSTSHPVGTSSPEAEDYSRFYSDSRRGKLAGSSARGRFYLALIFCAMRATDVLICTAGSPADRPRLIAEVATVALWTSALVAGVWFRHNWCRWGLAAAAVGSIGTSIYFLHDIFVQPMNLQGVGILAVAAIINASVAWVAVSSVDIKRLTSVAYGYQPTGYR